MLTQNETDHVFNQLVNGLVPERGLEALAVGIEKPRAELKRQLDIVQTGGGSVKFLRGGAAPRITADDCFRNIEIALGVFDDLGSFGDLD